MPRRGELKTLGLGSAGRTVAANEIEAVAMKQILENPNLGKVIQRMKPISDLRWEGWRKMYFDFGNKQQIHFNGQWENGVLKAVDDFKFK